MAASVSVTLLLDVRMTHVIQVASHCGQMTRGCHLEAHRKAPYFKLRLHMQDRSPFF